jgi:2-oxoglutarate dehydrogenase E2 component (dihydrolipoamide succinyltransferase)
MLCELETDKVSVEVPAPASGTLSRNPRRGRHDRRGRRQARRHRRQRRCGVSRARGRGGAGPCGRFRDGGQGRRGRALRQKADGREGSRSRTGQGTGRDGRIMKEDVLRRVRPRRPRPPPGCPAGPRAPLSPEDAAREERVKMTRLRQTIAKRLKDAQNTAAMLTTYNEVDMTEVMALRNEYKDLFEKKHGVRWASCPSSPRPAVPRAEGGARGQRRDRRHRYRLQELRPHGHRRRHAHGPRGAGGARRRSDVFAEIEKEIAEKGRRARDGKLSMAEMQGGTFTISNGGVYGSLMSSPILNPPQSGILGMHKIQERPMVIGGEIKWPPDDVSRAQLRPPHRRRQGRGDLPRAREGRAGGSAAVVDGFVRWRRDKSRPTEFA